MPLREQLALWASKLRRNVMADVQVKTGGYTILAKTTQEFFFWWGDNALPAAYFDVSIEPNPKIFDMKPLTEERRKVTLFSGSPRQSMLILTLKNDNDFDVDFFANHIRVNA
jgi:hypothetical protein